MPTTAPPSDPFTWLKTAVDGLVQRLQPPPWAVQEFHQRLVLMLNHVLQQEPEAMARLKRQTGRVARLAWRQFTLKLVVTPAGLVDVADEALSPDLSLEVTEPDPAQLLAVLGQGQKPPVRIEGDVQFAAELNWLLDHVRWDVEEDLSKLTGDAAAHRICQVGRALAQALRSFAGGVGSVIDKVVSEPASAARPDHSTARKPGA